jgi:hypothetical protein
MKSAKILPGKNKIIKNAFFLEKTAGFNISDTDFSRNS